MESWSLREFSLVNLIQKKKYNGQPSSFSFRLLVQSRSQRTPNVKVLAWIIAHGQMNILVIWFSGDNLLGGPLSPMVCDV